MANGVSRFSRLLPAQVNAEPDAAHDRAELGVGQHVRPRQRRLAFAVEHDDVLAAVGREAAEAVLHDERRDRRRASAAGSGARQLGRRAARRAPAYSHGAGRSSCGARSPRSPRSTTRATAASRRRSASGMPSARSRNMPPGLSEPARPRRLLHELRQQVLHLVEVVGGMLVEDHDVGAQPLDAPVLLRLQQLPHERQRRRPR